MRRLLACLLLVAVVLPGAAVADHLDPKKRFNRADQARAKAMLLRATDFPAGFKATPSGPDTTHVTCEALSEADLTLTGEAESRDFEGGAFAVTSFAQVYASAGDSLASWRRGTSAAGMRCLREEFRREAARYNIVLLSFERIAFPRAAQQSVAFRAVGRVQGVRAVIDTVVMRQGRAQTAVQALRVAAPPPRADVRRYASLVAGRMERAMRGA